MSGNPWVEVSQPALFFVAGDFCRGRRKQTHEYNSNNDNHNSTNTTTNITIIITITTTIATSAKTRPEG